MKTARATKLAAAAGALVILGAVLAPGCTSSECTPENHDLGEAPRLTLRMLPGRSTTDGPCAKDGLRVLTSEAELQQAYEPLGIKPGDESYPVVDFARERVIVNESSRTEGLSWAVQQGDTAVVGLLGCGLAPPVTCAVQLGAVTALVTRVESRTCEPVRCGPPPAAPPKR